MPMDETPPPRKVGHSSTTRATGVRPRDSRPLKNPYAAPRLRAIPHEELPSSLQNLFYTVKYVYINDVFAKYRETFIEEALKGATFHKYRLLFDTFPCTFEKCDVIIVGGNDLERLAAFMRVNRPLVQRTPTIAVAGTLNPRNRAELIKLGYDDVVNLKGLHATEFAARVAAIFNRYRLTEEKTQRLTKYIGSLSDICEISKLTRSQRLVLEALFDARDYFCRYGHLRTIIARNYNTPSLMHLRVIIHGIKAHMKPGHAIENVRGLGYRITFQEKP